MATIFQKISTTVHKKGTQNQNPKFNHIDITQEAHVRKKSNHNMKTHQNVKSLP